MNLFSKLFAILFFLNIIFAQSQFSPQHEAAYENNLALASLSPLQTMPDGAGCKGGSYQNPIACAFFLPLPSPQVDNRISTQSSKLLWAWGADAPKNAEYMANSGGCAPDRYVFSRQGEPEISGTLTYSIQNYSKTYEINSQSQNPLNADFREIPSELLSTQNIPPYLPQMQMDFDGKISATYFATRYFHVLVITGKSAICTQFATSFSNTYEYGLHSQNVYLLEYAEPQIILLQPIDNGQSAYATQLKSAILSNLQAQKIIFGINGQNISYSNFGIYSITHDSLGFSYVNKTQITPNDSPDYSWAKQGQDENASFFSNYTCKFLAAKEFG
ncbi:MAG: hypothetical protein V1822_04060, partial [Candidatus Micrarchaeota archaeon]